MVEVYGIKINEPIHYELYKYLFSFVSDEKRERIEKINFIEDAKRTLFGDLMVRYLACGRLNLYNNKLKFKCNEFGKPFLQGYPNFHFNISHSGNWVVCAISEKKIGVDIEQVKSINFDIAKRFFSEGEYNRLMLQPEYLQLNYFYDLWTLKESYIKYIGKGLSIPLNSFNIRCNDYLISITPNVLPPVYFSRIIFESEYKLSVCSESFIPLIKVNLIDINSIVQLRNVNS